MLHGQNAFPPRVVRFATEIPPARETLATSRTLYVTGTVAMETCALTGLELAQEVLEESQGPVLPLVP